MTAMNETTLTPDERNALAQAVQAHVPFVAAPFAQMARSLGLRDAQVLGQMQAWRDEGLLREISAIVEGGATDYASALVTGRVPAHGLERAVAAVNAHPTVTHNYLREHAYNLWFTIAVPAHMGLGRTLEVLAREAGVEAWHALRRERTFKIGVSYDLATRRNAQAAGAAQGAGNRHGEGRGHGRIAAGGVALGADEQTLVRVLQCPLPLAAEPFAALARSTGTSAAELLAFGERNLGGLIRRYAGTFNHRKLGIDGNGMIVWQVPPAEWERVGQALAAVPEVSHCYARNALPDFPYTLYSMAHTADRETCRALAGRLAREVGVAGYDVLFSTREFKKERLRYFLPDLEQWWARHAGKECEAC